MALRRAVHMVLCALLLSGCWSRVEVNDLAIIPVVAVDLLPDGRLRMAVNFVLPAQFGGAGGQGQEAEGGRAVMTVYESGTSLLEIARRIQLMTPRRMFWGHLKTIILGEPLARNGVREVMDFFSRHREVRLTAYVVVAEGEALHALEGFPELEKLIAEAIREMAVMRLGVETQLKEFLRTLGTPGVDPVAPLLRLIGAESEEKGSWIRKGEEFQLAGTALFRDDRLVGWLDEQESRGLLWLMGRVKQGVVSLELPGLGRVSSQLMRATTERSVQLRGNQPVFSLHVVAEDDLWEVQAPLDVGDPQVVRRLEKMIADSLVDRIHLALDRLQELGVDSFGFGLQVSRDAPRAWEQLEKRWRDVFPSARVEIAAEAHIRRTGMSSKPRGVPEPDVRTDWKEE